MSNNTNAKKLIGLELGQYIKVAYILCLASVVLHFIFTLILSQNVPILSSLLGFFGWGMGLMGWLKFHDDLGPIGTNHARFISVFGIFIIMATLILMPILSFSGFSTVIFAVLFSVIEGGFLFLGLRLWKNEKELNKETLCAEFKSVKTRIVSKIEKKS